MIQVRLLSRFSRWRKTRNHSEHNGITVHVYLDYFLILVVVHLDSDGEERCTFVKVNI